MNDAFNRIVTDNPVCQMNDNFITVFNRRIINTVDSSAVFVIYNNVLSNINKTAGHITCVSSLQSSIRKTLARTVRRNKVFDNRKTFLEVRTDRKFDDFSARLSHQSAHSRKL